MASLDFDDAFKHLLGRGGDWEVDVDEPGARISHLRSEAGFVVRFDYDVPEMPFELAERVSWPELDYSGVNSSLNEYFWGLRTRVERVFAPGDVLAETTRTGLSRLGLGQAYDALLGFRDSARPHSYVRSCMRRDFPELGHIARVDLECDSRGVPTGSQALSDRPGEVLCVAPLGNDTNGTRVTWAVRAPPLAGWVLKLMRQPVNRLLTMFVRMHADMPCSYAVVVVQQCTRGPPLRLCPGGSWEPLDRDAPFWLPGYLAELLCALGFPCEVFGSHAGQELVPYQAALPWAAWLAVAERVAAAWHAQRAAYRRHHGGSGAPRLREAPEPRYVGQQQRPSSAESRLWKGEVPVHGSFVHFPSRGELLGTHTRAHSLPPVAVA